MAGDYLTDQDNEGGGPPYNESDEQLFGTLFNFSGEVVQEFSSSSYSTSCDGVNNHLVHVVVAGCRYQSTSYRTTDQCILLWKRKAKESEQSIRKHAREASKKRKEKSWQELRHH